MTHQQQLAGSSRLSSVAARHNQHAAGFDPALVLPDIPDNLARFARDQLFAYNSQLRGLMDQLGIASEFELVSGHVAHFHSGYHRKKRSAHDLKERTAMLMRDIRQLFRQNFQTRLPRKDATDAHERHAKLLASAYYVAAWDAAAASSTNAHQPRLRPQLIPWIVADHLCALKRAAFSVSSTSSTT